MRHRARRRYCCGAFLACWLWVGISGAQQEHPTPLPLDQYLALLDEPQRDQWQQPDAVMQALRLQNGQVVADVGAGSGYFTLRLARAVGPQGTVFALDVEESARAYLRQRVDKESLRNVQILPASPHELSLTPASLDLAFLCNIYHHLTDREAYLRTLRPALKPAGRLVIIDFYKREGLPVGPPPAMQLGEETVQKELQEAGLQVIEKLTFLPYQYMLIARPMTQPNAPSPREP